MVPTLGKDSGIICSQKKLIQTQLWLLLKVEEESMSFSGQMSVTMKENGKRVITHMLVRSECMLILFSADLQFHLIVKALGPDGQSF